MTITWAIAKTAKDLWDKAIDAVVENTDAWLWTITWAGSKVFADNTPKQIENNNTDAGVFTLPWINDNVTRDIKQEPTPEITTQEVPETTEQTPSTDVTRPEWWVVVDNKTTPTQDTTTQNITEEKKTEASKANPEPSQEDKDIKALEEFNDALDKWASQEDIQLFAKKNPKLLPSIKWAVKAHFKNASNVEFFNKYSAYSDKQLYSAMNSGDFVVWDNQYALLSPQQRASFEAYKSLEESAWEVSQNNLGTNELNMDNIANQISSTNLREEYNKMKLNPVYTQAQSDLEQIRLDKKAIDKKIKGIADAVMAEHKWVPANVINGIIKDRTKILNDERSDLVDRETVKLGTISNHQSEMANELKFLEIENENNRYVYEQALEQYNTDRKMMTDIAIKEFEANNKIMAEETKHQRTLELEAFKSQLKENEKGWVYKTDRSGKLIYLVNGVSKTVTWVEWEVVFTEENKVKWFKDTTYSNDWVFTTVRTYDSWDEPSYFTHSADWTSTSTMSIYDRIAQIPATWLQCWEAVNKYVSSLWVTSKDFWVWDTYESKSKYIDDTIETPSPWDVAIWNNWTVDSASWVDNWHIWIVTWPVQPDWTVEITDWNADWKETKSTRMVSIDTIKKSDWWFYNPTWYTAWQKAFLEWFDWKITSTTLTAMKKLWLSAEDAYGYKSWAITADDAIQIGQATDMISSLKWMMWMKRTDRMTSWVVQYLPVFWDNEADFRADFNFLKGQLTLKNLMDLKAWWATFGALSNEELKMIENSATKLATNLSNEKWNEEVTFLITKFEDMMTRAGGTVEIDPPVINTNDEALLQEYNSVKSTIGLSYLN